MSDGFGYKRIADPLYGSVGFSKCEIDLIETSAFQRLRNVKHLGLVNYVFPGADFSRFEHCLGACHMAGRLIDSLNSTGTTISMEEKQLYRAAALLHDVGHYPYSHTMEDAVGEWVRSGLFTGGSGVPASSPKPGLRRILKHEDVGAVLLGQDRALLQATTKHKLDVAKITSTFTTGQRPNELLNLISGDLDADRLDFLVRTAIHTGLPYGRVDVDYLLTQLRTAPAVDPNRRQLCLTKKALRTADHFLLGRYFDRIQVVFHKTVVAFEWLLRDCIVGVLECGYVDCSAEGVRKMVRGTKWAAFDDARMIEWIRRMSRDNSASAPARDKAKAFLGRRAPKLVAWRERFDPLRDVEHSNFSAQRSRLEAVRDQLSVEFGIPSAYWNIWDLDGFEIMSMRASVPSTRAMDQEDRLKVIHILDGAGQPQPITEFADSMMCVLADRGFYGLRLYLLPPTGGASQLDAIYARARALLDDPTWEVRSVPEPAAFD